MILQKSLKEGFGPSSSATILGLKVVGGKPLPNNRIGAVIEKVKKGSIADTVGHLLPGKMIQDSVTFWFINAFEWFRFNYCYFGYFVKLMHS